MLPLDAWLCFQANGNNLRRLARRESRAEVIFRQGWRLRRIASFESGGGNSHANNRTPCDHSDLAGLCCSITGYCTELTVTDLARAKTFYGHIFGWTFSDSPSPDFVSIKGAGVPGGILRDLNKKAVAGDVKIFFAVEDISATLERAKQLGAEVLLGETRVSPARTLAEFRDPDGNVIGIMHELSASGPAR